MGVYRHHLFNLNVQRLRQMFHGKIKQKKKKRNEKKILNRILNVIYLRNTEVK